MNSEIKNRILAEWLAGNVSEEDLEILKHDPDYENYVRILEAIDGMDIPEYPIQEEWSRLQTRLSDNKQMRVKLVRRFAFIAASVVLLVGGFLFYPAQTKLFTAGGEQLIVFLPDSSKVHINSMSEIKYKKRAWEKKRVVDLKGEAFFYVKKGNEFTVNTSNGLVKVLGTSFNVFNRLNKMDVTCYTGKIEVKGEDNKVVTELIAGEKYKNGTKSIVSNTTVTEPSWMHGESSFENASLQEVLSEVERQYGIKIQYNQLPDVEFTGAFPHENINIALEIVLGTYGIGYHKTSTHTIELIFE